MGYALAFISGANCMIIAKIKNITKSCFLTSHPKIGLKSQTSLDLKYFLQLQNQTQSFNLYIVELGLLKKGQIHEISHLRNFIAISNTARKVSVLEVFLVRNFPHSDYSVSLRIQSKCGRIRTRKTPNMEIFHAVEYSL